MELQDHGIDKNTAQNWAAFLIAKEMRKTASESTKANMETAAKKLGLWGRVQNQLVLLEVFGES